MTLSLAELIAPHALQDFFDDVWEREPLHVPGSAERFRDLWSSERVWQALEAPGARHPAVALASPDGTLRPSGYTQNKRIRISAARAAVDAGATVVLSGLQRTDANIAALCRVVSAATGARTQLNAYRSPAGQAGFAPHWDVHDVFVMQLEGTKRWRLYGAPVPLPLASMRAKAYMPPVGDVTHEHVLEAGDVLYVPRGWVHDATAEDTPSLHLTLGVVPTRSTEVAIEAVAQAALSNALGRRGLRLGWGREGATDPSASIEQVRALLRAVADDDDALYAALGVATDTVLATTPRPARPVWPTPTRDMTLSLVPGVLVSIERDGDDVVLHTLDASLSLTGQCAPAIAALVGGAVRVDALPGLDDEGRRVLATRLLGEGVVEG